MSGAVPAVALVNDMLNMSPAAFGKLGDVSRVLVIPRHRVKFIRMAANTVWILFSGARRRRAIRRYSKRGDKDGEAARVSRNSWALLAARKTCCERRTSVSSSSRSGVDLAFADRASMTAGDDRAEITSGSSEARTSVVSVSAVNDGGVLFSAERQGSMFREMSSVAGGWLFAHNSGGFFATPNLGCKAAGLHRAQNRAYLGWDYFRVHTGGFLPYNTPHHWNKKAL